MTRLTEIINGMSSVNLIDAINNNFSFLNTLTVGADGVNLVPQASSDFITDGSAWWTTAQTKTWNEATHSMTFERTSEGILSIYKDSVSFVIGKKYKVTFRAKSSNLTERLTCGNSSGTYGTNIKNPELTTEYQDYEFNEVQLGNNYREIRTRAAVAIGSEITIDDIVIVEVPKDVASLTTIDNTMVGQTLLDNLNDNLTALNNCAPAPISLTSIEIGFTGALLNSTFNSLYVALGKAVAEDGYFIEYYYSDLHICTTRDNKMLAFDGVDTVSLSIDGGASYPYSKQVVGMTDIVNFSYIFANGNILFCTHQKAYYSTDNLATVNESTVLDIEGNAFVPALVDNFRVWDMGTPVFIDGTEILVWGKAVMQGGQEINVWETFDGITIRSVWKNGVTEPTQALTIGEIDNINYQPLDGKFWMQTTGPHWITGVRNMSTGAWTWEHVMSNLPYDLNTDRIRSNGFVFWGDYVYWNAEAHGIMRAEYSEILDTTKHESMFMCFPTTIRNMWGVAAGVKDDEMVHSYGLGRDNIISTIDGLKYKVTNLTVGKVGEITSAFMPITPKNADGWYRADIVTNLHDLANSENHQGVVLMFRLIK